MSVLLGSTCARGLPGVEPVVGTLTRPPAGPRGRPRVGTHSGSAWPRYDIYYGAPGVSYPPPNCWGFRVMQMGTHTQMMSRGETRRADACGLALIAQRLTQRKTL